MIGRTPSLGPLLIISAIDLLLCCLTAGIMLFLIFQPSQRTDRSSALFQSEAGATSAPRPTVAGQQVPTIVIVDNRGPTKLVAEPSSDYQVISSPSSRSTIFRSLGPAGSLHLVPADMSHRFSAHIVLTSGNKLVSVDRSCFGGAASEVTVDPTSDPPTVLKCPNRCVPADVANKPGDVHVVLRPKGRTIPAYAPLEKCYALRPGESLETIRTKVASCGPNAKSGVPEFYGDAGLYDCLWRSFLESRGDDCQQSAEDRVGFWQGLLNPTTSDNICPASADSGASPK